jgi:hypothetical protein
MTPALALDTSQVASTLYAPGAAATGITYSPMLLPLTGPATRLPRAVAVRGPSGDESMAEFQQRIDRAVGELVARNPAGRIILCTHSGVIDAILRWAFGIAPCWSASATSATWRPA